MAGARRRISFTIRFKSNKRTKRNTPTRHRESLLLQWILNFGRPGIWTSSSSSSVGIMATTLVSQLQLVIYSLLIVAHESKPKHNPNPRLINQKNKRKKDGKKERKVSGSWLEKSTMVVYLIFPCRSSGNATRTLHRPGCRMRSRSRPGSIVQRSGERFRSDGSSRRSRSTTLRRSRAQSPGGKFAFAYCCPSLGRLDPSTRDAAIASLKQRIRLKTLTIQVPDRSSVPFRLSEGRFRAIRTLTWTK